jgi:hypothetical protein
MEVLEFRYTKGRVWQRVTYVAVVLAFAVLAIHRAAESEGKGRGGWFAVVVLAFLGLYAFRGVFDRRPVLRISAAGVWFRGWHHARPVSWSDVSDVRYIPAARGEPFITLELANATSDGRVPRQLQFRTGELDVENEEALRLVKQYWHAAKQGRGDEV